MPNINIDENVYVSVGDFYEECSGSDIDKLIKLLLTDGYISQEDVDSDDSRTIGEDYQKAINKLKYIRKFMSIEDEQKIIEISKKY